MNTVKGYEKLVAVYQDAHDQAAKGKGDERHANGQPFHEQRMQQISGLLRSSDGMAFQAIKKLTEGLQFEDHARREAELLGALNYIAGIVIYYRELQDTRPLDNDASLVYNADRLVIKNSEGDVIFDSNGVPLTNEQLCAGDWYCTEVDADVIQLLKDRGISCSLESKFDFKYADYVKYVKCATPINSEPTKEIIRKGNEFYYYV